MIGGSLIARLSRATWFCAALVLTGMSLVTVQSVIGDDGAWAQMQRRSGFTAPRAGEDEAIEYRYEALARVARFKGGTKTITDVEYRDEVVEFMEPQAVVKTVSEDKGCWKCCRSFLGLRRRWVWCPRVVEKPVAEVVEVKRQRIERVPHEITRVIANPNTQPVVVHSRRPVPPKPIDVFERSVLASRGASGAGLRQGIQESARFGDDSFSK